MLSGTMCDSCASPVQGQELDFNHPCGFLPTKIFYDSMKTDDSYLNSKLMDLLKCLIMSVIECSGYECDRNPPDVFIVYEIALSETLK